MKQWKDGKNRFELHLCNKQEGVLYRLEKGYLFRVYTDGGEFDAAIHASTVEEAKQAAEKWLVSHLANRNRLSRKLNINSLNETKRKEIMKDERALYK